MVPLCAINMAEHRNDSVITHCNFQKVLAHHSVGVWDRCVGSHFIDDVLVVLL